MSDYKNNPKVKRRVDEAIAATSGGSAAGAVSNNKATTATATTGGTGAASVGTVSTAVKQDGPAPADNTNATSKEADEKARLAKAAAQCDRIPCGRSRVLITGGGRAGKTSVSRSFQGLNFEHTESTKGIDSFSVDCSYSSLQRDVSKWSAHQRPDKELEFGIARQIASESRAKQPVQPQPQSQPLSSPKPSSLAGGAVVVPSISSPSASPGPRAAPVHVPSAPKVAFDNEAVMQCLGSVAVKSDLILAMYDFGGQSVFSVIHHLFFTESGFYLIVFNMVELLSADQSIVQSCLSEIKFWFNSIIVHTVSSETKQVAPYAFVGTHKDMLSSQDEVEQISLMLEEIFSDSFAWLSIVKNAHGIGRKGPCTLNLFAVDNTKSSQDVAIQGLMRSIELSLKELPQVTALTPVAWLLVLDKLLEKKKTTHFISHDEFVSVASSCNVPVADIPLLLSFLRSIGEVLWVDEASLCDCVVLDALKFLVEPATEVICKLRPTAGDSTNHEGAVHKRCAQLYFADWRRFKDRGIASADIVKFILGNSTSEVLMVMKLMVKYGLMVPLSYRERDDVDDELLPLELLDKQVSIFDVDVITHYLVSACFSPCKNEELLGANWLGDNGTAVTSTCYLAFSSMQEFDNQTVSKDLLASVGFLPDGLFQRFIGKIAVWISYFTDPDLSNLESSMYSDVVVFSIGKQYFRLKLLVSFNCIQVDIVGKSGLLVLNKVTQLLQTTIDECMASLRFTVLVAHSESISGGTQKHSEAQDTENVYFLHLKVAFYKYS